MTFLQRVIVNLLTLVTIAVLFPSWVHVSGLTAGIFAAVVLALLNMVVKPILELISLPITILTLGLFSFVINAGMLELTSVLVDGLSISSFWIALLIALILSFVNSVVTRNMIE